MIVIYEMSNSERDELTFNASDIEQVPALSMLLAGGNEKERKGEY